MDFETLVLHGSLGNPLLDGPVAPPIQLSTTFVRDPNGEYPKGYTYSRARTPNRDALEQTLAQLEGGCGAAAFASGSAAMVALLQTLGTGDHVLIPQESYHGTRAMLRELFPRWGLGFDFVDMTDRAAVAAAIRPNTRMILIETPSNPRMHVTDIGAIVEEARKAGVQVVADNTVATPILQRPLEFGCDFVVHSTTKYINGHSDVLGGVVVAREHNETFAKLRNVQLHGGAVPSAFDCWLTLRGIKTLPQRVRAQSAAAMAIAEFLAAHPRVSAVHYAGLESHPRHDLARRQMTMFGGLVSFEVPGGAQEAIAVAAKVKIIRRATSLGGVESLIEQRASMEGPDTSTPPNLLRLSVGLESIADLKDDLSQALA